MMSKYNCEYYIGIKFHVRSVTAKGKIDHFCHCEDWYCNYSRNVIGCNRWEINERKCFYNALTSVQVHWLAMQLPFMVHGMHLTYGHMDRLLHMFVCVCDREEKKQNIVEFLKKVVNLVASFIYVDELRKMAMLS